MEIILVVREQKRKDPQPDPNLRAWRVRFGRTHEISTTEPNNNHDTPADGTPLAPCSL